MPTYQYVCKACDHELEEFQSITDPPLTRCPQCGTVNLVRVLGGGAGLIFKGTGFYLTDYRKSGDPSEPHPKKKKPDDKPGSAPAAPSGKDSKE